MKFYICRHCGNVITKLTSAQVPVKCCGEEMQLLEAGVTDAAQEKHVPAVTVEGSLVKVNVGSVTHPMTAEHFIQWVVVETDRDALIHWPQGEKAALASGRDGAGPLPDEMIRAANAYVDFIHELWAGFTDEPTVCIEQQVDLSGWVPEGFGTCDCLLIGNGVLHIVDFKYGQGVPVSPVENPQLLYYALGGYDLFRATDEIETVRLSIVQPRIQAEPETWELPLEKLLEWADDVLHPLAVQAWNGDGVRHPGSWCRWCKLYPACTAWKDKYELDGFEAEAPPTPAALTDEELGGRLKKLEGVAQYAKDLEAYAQQRLLEGHAVPGYKLVEGRSVRTWTDQAAAFDALRADGYDDAVLYTREPITLTSVEKLLGKKRFAAVMAGFVKRDPGLPKLADAADRRPEYHNLEGFNQEV